MNKNRSALQVRQVKVTDPIAAGGRYDYADAFEVRLPGPDLEVPATWVGAGLDKLPAVVEWIASLLGVHDDPATPTNPIPGWRIVESSAAVVHIERSLALMRVVAVGRKIEPSRRLFTSVLYYKRPVLARLVWAVVGVGHRRMARRLITCQISPVVEDGNRDSERAG